MAYNAMIEVPEFHWKEGRKDYYRGSVSELTPVVRYMSGGVKVFQSLFQGVPYQLGHSTTVLRIRLEEHVPDASRFPERTITVEYPSDAEGELTYGDDVTVETVVKHNKHVAKNIWVNENTSRRRVGGGFEIPAWIIRLFAVCVAMLIIGTVCCVISFVNSPIFGEVVAAFVVILACLIYVTGKARRRRW